MHIRREDGWTWSNGSTQIGGESACTLYYTETSALLQDDDSLRIILKDWYESNDLSDDDCTISAASELANEADCMHYEVIVGKAQ
ncbi:MAG: hypothetical protein HN348_14955 [Proteobacteria bacterium]|nr:hypothetical protein [Pseudomonadota bacterium]